MEKSIVSEGKTSNEAIQNGLKILGCKLEDVDVKILENTEKKVFFSILDPRVVKVELTLKENVSNKDKEKEVIIASDEDFDLFKSNIELFLNDFCKKFDDLKYSLSIDENKFVRVVIEGEDSSKLIGYRGEVVNSIQNLLSAIGNKNTKIRVRVTVDICNYKEKREKTLIELANKIEKTVIRRRKKVILEPMNAYDRKVIHTALQNSNKVTTYSIGDEPFRKIVVDLK